MKMQKWWLNMDAANPAFLVSKLILVVAANTGKSSKPKKGQFMSPESMKHAVQKVLD
jgi:2-dehydro-3-deoxyphosphooctonate aldolase (KDO 8-P synthase)